MEYENRDGIPSKTVGGYKINRMEKEESKMRCSQCSKKGKKFKVSNKLSIEALWKAGDAWICAECWEFRFGSYPPQLEAFENACCQIAQLTGDDLLSVEIG